MVRETSAHDSNVTYSWWNDSFSLQPCFCMYFEQKDQKKQCIANYEYKFKIM